MLRIGTHPVPDPLSSHLHHNLLSTFNKLAVAGKKKKKTILTSTK